MNALAMFVDAWNQRDQYRTTSLRHGARDNAYAVNGDLTVQITQQNFDHRVLQLVISDGCVDVARTSSLTWIDAEDARAWCDAVISMYRKTMRLSYGPITGHRKADPSAHNIEGIAT